MQFWGLPPGLKMLKRRYGCRQNSVTRAKSQENTDVETDTTPGVEGNETAQQFRCLPPELEKSNGK